MLIYVVFEKIFEKTGTCDIRQKASYTVEISKHTACGFKIERYIYWEEDFLNKLWDIMSNISLKLFNTQHKKCFQW